MKPSEFPALYLSADHAAIGAQSTYKRMLKLQYTLLVAAATLSLWFGTSIDLYVVYALLVTGSSALLIYTSVKQPERAWYKSRALAESIKTSSWRYMMRASPFEDSVSLREVQGKFSAFLQDILRANRGTSDPFIREPSGGDQITKSMNCIRARSLQERKSRYRTDRIEEQRSWYVTKVKENRREYRIWVGACVTVQILAIFLALVRIRYHSNWDFWPTPPLLVLASSIVGWIQIRKFNETASSYNMAAHEIGIIQTQMDHVSSEAEFAEFVNEAERAFSREHTQWTARKND